MSNNTINISMDVELVSKGSFPNGKPYWISIDSTTAILPSGKRIIFDFLDSYGNAEVLPDGHCKVEMTKDNFDEEYFFSSNEGVEDVDWSHMEDWKFEEIFVTGDSVEGEFEDIGMGDFEFTNVVFGVWDEETDIETSYTLSKEQLKHLNDAIMKEWSN